MRLSTGGDDELHAPQRAVLMPDRAGATASSLLVSHLFDLLAYTVEVTTPPDPTDWTSSAGVRTCTVAGVEELSSAYYRVSLITDDELAEQPEAAPGAAD